MNKILECINVSKKIDDTYAIKNVSFPVEKGRVVGLLGLNGCGKSTLLKLISGFSVPTDGKVLFNGRLLASNNRSNISFLPDVNFISPSITVKDAVKIYNMFYLDFDRNKAFEYLSYAEVPLNECFENLSSGMRQKALLTFCVCRRSSLYVLDEPLKDVEASYRVNFLKRIIAETDKSSSFVIGTQRIFRTQGLFDDLGFVVDGQLRLFENTEKLMSSTGKNIEQLFEDVYGCL